MGFYLCESESCLSKYEKIHAFLSYSRLDKCEVLLVENILLSLGIPRENIFRDEASILVGSDWEKDILKAIEGTTIFFCLWTNSSIESEMVVKERTYVHAMNLISSVDRSESNKKGLIKKDYSKCIIDVICEELNEDLRNPFEEYYIYQQIRFDKKDDFSRYGEKILKLDISQVLLEMSSFSRAEKSEDRDPSKDSKKVGEAEMIRKRIGVFEELGVRYMGQYQFEKAKFLYEKAKILYNGAQEEEKSNTLKQNKIMELEMKIGEISFLQGDYSDASSQYVKLLKKCKKITSCSSSLTLRIKNNLAKTYYIRGEYEEAQRVYDEVMRERKEELEAGDKGKWSEDGIILASMNGLGRVYRDQGQYQKAQEIYEKVIKALDGSGDDNELILSMMNDLGLVYWNLGYKKKAWSLHKKTLSKMKTVLGETHPETLSNMRNLAWSYAALKDYELAQDLIEETKTKSESTLGKEHPETLDCIKILADLYRYQGDPDKALQLLKSIRILSEEQFGKEHQKTLTIINALARTYEALDCFESAEKLYEMVKMRAERELGSDHRVTKYSSKGLAKVQKLKNE